MDIYDGDPRLILGADGSRLEYKGGQPVMDKGVENIILIDLFTQNAGENSHTNGWCGNHLMRSESAKVGSNFVDQTLNQPMTINGLENIEAAQVEALTRSPYGEVESTASNPKGDEISILTNVESPAGTFTIRTDAVSQRWQAQVSDPANERL